MKIATNNINEHFRILSGNPTVAQLGKHVRLYLTSLTIDVQAQNPAFSCQVRIIMVM